MDEIVRQLRLNELRAIGKMIQISPDTAGLDGSIITTYSFAVPGGTKIVNVKRYHYHDSQWWGEPYDPETGIVRDIK